MDISIILDMAFHVIGGLGIFLLGMKYLSEGIQAVASHQLRSLIGSVTNNRFVAVTVGLLFTCMVQSSSITTVMVVGLVNSSVMTLGQAIGVIMGANIGTTITGWILVIKIGKYGLPILGGAALFHLFAKNERLRFIAMVVMGVGMVFFGLELMKNGFKPIRSIPEFAQMFAYFQADSYFGVLKAAAVGCALTFIVQSSSATLAITIGLASTGSIDFPTAAALVLGENIGTTITAYLASLGATLNARRAAYAHIVFNMLGVFWITSLFPIYLELVKGFLDVDPGVMKLDGAGMETFPYVVMGIATVHSGFNVANTLLFLPFIRVLERGLVRLFPDRGEERPMRMTTLDENLLETPLVALETIRSEIGRMGEIVREMMDQLGEAASQEKIDRKLADKLFHREEVLDQVKSEITVFITDLLAAGLPHQITDEGRRQLEIVDEHESISDYAVRALKLHLRLRNDGGALIPEDREGLGGLHGRVTDYISLVTTSFATGENKILFKAQPQSEAINHEIRRLRAAHATHMAADKRDPAVTMIYSDLLNDYRRMKDHALSIARDLDGRPTLHR